MSSQQLAAFFYTVAEPELYKCSICKQPRKQAQRTGYTNLMSHLNAKHPTHGDEYAESQRRNLTSLEVFGFVDEVTTQMYDWLRLIVERNLSLSKVENQLTRQLVRMKPTSADTLKIYMHRVAGRVGNTIAKEMGEFLGIMLNGWSSGTRHFVVVFVVYHGGAGLCESLVGLAVMVDGQTADAHIEFIESILAVYDKDLSMIKFLAADNCSTNRGVATKLNIPLMGCASHRFNLAMVRLLSDSENLINMIQLLMMSLRQPHNAAQLALHTQHLPETSNVTRWSSVLKMVHKCVRIRDAVKHVPAVEELVPRQSDNRRILVLHDKMEELREAAAPQGNAW